MKTYKTMLSVVLAIMMLVTMIVPAWAAQEGTLTGGSITINDAVKDQTYSIYQILYLESYNATSSAYAYKANSAWESWLKDQTTYVTVDAQGYVTWVEGADAAAFAKAAEAYAREQISVIGSDGQPTVDEDGNNITTDRISSVATPVKATTTTVTFTGLKLGYYLVTTTLGSLCSLDTTNPSVVMYEKNEEPKLDKLVEEDSNNRWGKYNDADINQTVNFKAIITIQENRDTYVYHDTMSDGLTFGSVTKVEKVVKGQTDVVTELTVNTQYTISNPGTEKTGDKCTFEVAIKNEVLDGMKPNDQFVIYYTATVNAGAAVGDAGNPNTGKLEYVDKGDNTSKFTPDSETKTYTWETTVLKYGNGNESNVLSGAEFVLLRKSSTTETAPDEVATFTTVEKEVETGETGEDNEPIKEKITVYKVSGWIKISTITDEDDNITWPDGSVLTTNANGKIEIDGLDADTYHLREIKAPDGYNMLKDDQTFTITSTKNETETELTHTPVTTKVNNQSGTELPSTGGIGTTIFYCAGAILALGAFVLLVTKKRMGRE